jgi:hypothetical protein
VTGYARSFPQGINAEAQLILECIGESIGYRNGTRAQCEIPATAIRTIKNEKAYVRKGFACQERDREYGATIDREPKPSKDYDPFRLSLHCTTVLAF